MTDWVKIISEISLVIIKFCLQFPLVFLSIKLILFAFVIQMPIKSQLALSAGIILLTTGLKDLSKSS
jgi:hypothetical protein